MCAGVQSNVFTKEGPICEFMVKLTRLCGGGKFELNFFPFDESRHVNRGSDQSVTFAIGNITPPKLLLVISKVRRMDGMRHFALSLEGLFSPVE